VHGTVTKKEESSLNYVENAVLSYGEIMSKNHKDRIENLNRANKGELFVLQYLSMRDTQVLPSELSAALQASTARISALLGALEKKGQIERDIDKSNRRNILVTITGAGRERVESEMKKIREYMSLIFTEMGEADTAEYLRLTKRFFDISQKTRGESLKNIDSG